jgi:hypothetical protein
MEKSISQIESFIKNLRLNEIIFKPHALTRMVERNLNEDHVREVVLRAPLAGLVMQDEEKFLVMFKDTGDKDLNVVARIVGDKLKIITAYPSHTVRRVK